ncbi:MAG: hypothetical protein QOH63_3487 [Acidobacteriota bacterium]|jgi:hypothetical protein|nr:hypothetical protein [Acidobacteriota bacterium]
MPSKEQLNHQSSARKNERGAALISVLLISALLLSAGGVLLLTTSMSATNPIDATAEMQAYYAAEAGLQRTLNVMRTKDIPAGTMPAGKTKLTFRDIVLNPTLATWIPFNGSTIGGVQTTAVGTNAFSVSITDPDDQNPILLLRKININPTYQPTRLNIQLMGYGPRRAKKVLNMVVLRSGLGGFQAPATITLRGSDAGLTAPLTLDTGNSNAVTYTGNDAAGGAGISAFAVTVPDVAPTLAGINRPSQVVGPPVSVLGPTSPLAGVPPTPEPEWLETADAARAYLADLHDDAVGDGRYFTTKPPASDMGTAGSPKFTFVDGDVDLGAGNNGTGLLVVTGNVTMHGNTDFNGVIFVLGGGSVDRSGGGNGTIAGGIVIAKFGATGGFLAPTFTTNGGGNSTIQYDSNAVAEATMTMPGFQVIGVVEK